HYAILLTALSSLVVLLPRPPPPRSPLFPYTTLFRSPFEPGAVWIGTGYPRIKQLELRGKAPHDLLAVGAKGRSLCIRNHELLDRSEEHTSELQSPCNLVCRLLLEKNKRQYVHRRAAV